MQCAQAQDLLHGAARQSEGGTQPVSASESLGPPEGFVLEENEEEMIKPARKLKEEKVNVGEGDSGDGTTSTGDGDYEFGVNPNDNPKLVMALRGPMEKQRARQQAEGDGEQDVAIVRKTLGGWAKEESNEEAPLQRAMAVIMARSRDDK